MGLKELFSALRKEGIPPDWYLIGDEGISECRREKELRGSGALHEGGR